MKIRRAKRYPLLLYRRAMERLWAPTLLLGGIMAALWAWTFMTNAPLFNTRAEPWLFVGAVVSLAFSLFAFLARAVAYVQVYPNFLRVVTPFLNLKVSFQRVHSVYPSDFHKLYPPNEAGWADRRFLEPFYGKTAVVVELTRYPLNRALLRLFLPRQMLLQRPSGFVLLVPDWIAFSTELDSRIGAWQQIQGRKATLARSRRG